MIAIGESRRSAWSKVHFAPETRHWAKLGLNGWKWL
jgi:hypothetical protein